MTIGILCLTFAVLVAVYMYVSRKMRKRYFKPFLEKNPQLKPFDEMPGPFPLPLIGSTYNFFNMSLEEAFQFFQYECKQAYPDPLRTKLGSWDVVNVFRAEHIEVIVNNSVHITKTAVYDFVSLWLGTGLLTSTGEKWHKRRKLITPTFHFKILDIFNEVFCEKTNILVKLLKQEADKNQPFDIKPFISRCALDIICQTAMGVTVNAQEDTDNEYLKAIYSISKCVVDRMLSPWLHRDFLWKYSENYRETMRCLKILHGFTDKVIAERKQEHEKNPNLFKMQNSEDTLLGKKYRLAFLDLLLYATVDGEYLTSVDIREEVDTFMFEGHDTTASAMCFALYMLGLHPDVQAKVHKEIDGVLGTSDIGKITRNDLAQLKYLEMVIKESLRAYPSVPVIGRVLNDDVVIGNYVCPKGIFASINIYSLHQDPAVYPNPEKFDPERFSPENCINRHPFAYLPFSAGPRNCIGQRFAMNEEKIILASILKEFEIKTLCKQEDFKPVGLLILRLSNECNVMLTPRKRSN